VKSYNFVIWNSVSDGIVQINFDLRPNFSVIFALILFLRLKFGLISKVKPNKLVLGLKFGLITTSGARSTKRCRKIPKISLSSS